MNVSPHAVAGGVAASAVLLLAGPAFAHVGVAAAARPPRAATATVNFKVPNERDDASTVKLEVTFPTDHPLASVMPQPVPGWDVKVTKRKLDKPLDNHGKKITEAAEGHLERRRASARHLPAVPGLPRPAARGRRPARLQGHPDVRQQGGRALDRAAAGGRRRAREPRARARLTAADEGGHGSPRPEPAPATAATAGRTTARREPPPTQRHHRARAGHGRHRHRHRGRRLRRARRPPPRHRLSRPAPGRTGASRPPPDAQAPSHWDTPMRTEDRAHRRASPPRRALTLTACGGGGDDGDEARRRVSAQPTRPRATVLDQPFAKPDLILTDTEGKKYDLLDETKGSRRSSTSATPTAPTSAR